MNIPEWQEREEERCSWPRCRQDCSVMYRAGATLINPAHDVKLCEGCIVRFGDLMDAAYAEREVAHA